MIKNLDKFPVIINIPVNWGDMDAFRHVNNVNYFKYFESARISYLEKINYSTIANKLHISVILAHIDCKFIIPLFYPDTIQVGAKITEIAKDRFSMDYAIYSTSQNKIAAIGKSTIVTYDYQNHCKVDIPKDILIAINQLENITI